MQKYLVIDVGSNSVRSMLVSNDKTIYKETFTTRLGEGLYKTGLISEENKIRTTDAIVSCINKGKTEGVDEVLMFATAAVRNSLNGDDFTSYVYDKTGIKVDVLSGEEEAEAGIVGALAGGDGCVVDEGGASTEVVMAKSGKIVYSHSLPVGAVVLKDVVGDDRAAAIRFNQEKLNEYGVVPGCDSVTAIGGTATTIGAIANGLKVYDRNIVNGTKLSVERLEEITDSLYLTTAKERVEKFYVNPKRAEIIACGAQLLLNVVKYLGAKSLVISENDNAEGYYYMKKKGVRYEKIGQV